MAGAGAIGCFVGGLMAAAGRDVHFLGRAHVLDGLRADGLRLTDFDGLEVALASQGLHLHDSPDCLAGADVILVTVKSGATAGVARDIAAHAPASATIVSLQNGMGNADVLRAHLPDHDIRPGMVPFNVVPRGAGGFHRATSGDIVIGAGPVDVACIMTVKGLAVSQSDAITSLQWGKFLINLNNAPNALSGLTLHEQLLSRPWRCLMADQMAEALRVLHAHGCPIRPTTPVPVGWVPQVLRLPTPLFRRAAARMLTVDPQARSSMAQDLQQGKTTEIDALQGRIIAMGQEKSIPTPLCLRMLNAVKAAERDGLRPHSPDSLRRESASP